MIDLSAKTLENKYFVAYASDPQAAGDDSAYNIAATNVWPVVFTTHHRNSSSYSTYTTILKCVQGTDVSEGSETPAGLEADEDDDNGGDGDDGDAAPRVLSSYAALVAAGFVVLIGML